MYPANDPLSREKEWSSRSVHPVDDLVKPMYTIHCIVEKVVEKSK